MSWVDLAKQLQSLVSGAFPLVATKFQLLGFLNPQISDELWPITSLLALVASGITYNLGQRFQKPKVARILALIGFGTAVASLLALISLVGNQFASGNPDLQDVFARSLFVLLFVGLGAGMGWCFIHVL